MLEKAVYARRNHTPILAVVILLMCSTSAQAADVLRVGLREEVHGLLAGQDGGAYAQVVRATGKTDVAREELAAQTEFGHVVTNDRLDEAVTELERVVTSALHSDT